MGTIGTTAGRTGAPGGPSIASAEWAGSLPGGDGVGPVAEPASSTVRPHRGQRHAHSETSALQAAQGKDTQGEGYRVIGVRVQAASTAYPGGGDSRRRGRKRLSWIMVAPRVPSWLWRLPQYRPRLWEAEIGFMVNSTHSSRRI
jgi:hypothetical protein